MKAAGNGPFACMWYTNSSHWVDLTKDLIEVKTAKGTLRTQNRSILNTVKFLK